MSEFDNAVPVPAAEPTPSATPAPATPGSFAPQSATPTVPQAPAIGAPDDRSTWVPPYRLRETREAAVRESQSQWAQKEAQYQAQLQQIQSQLHALVGVNPQNRNPEVDAIRQQFSQLYPGLSRLEERAAQLQQMMERTGDLEAQNQHYWETYGRQSMDRLFTHAQEALGGPLTEEGKRQLHASFVGFVQSSPEMQARYANDPTLVQEFWKQFTSSFIDPVRRTAQANVAGRVPQGLPQDTPAGIPRQAGPQPRDIDERMATGWALYNQNAKP